MSNENSCLLKLKFVPYGNRLDVNSSVVLSKRVAGLCDDCGLFRFCNKVLFDGVECVGVLSAKSSRLSLLESETSVSASAVESVRTDLVGDNWLCVDIAY
ncbi:hypothetical protein [Spiroplasma endosymbiont of Tipula paludosa]|uniref:hypothetical protein n=1 Tax=Spiroplasma endosymbiont of Tipula paludosa TaxID=3066295 RepID=UPI0035C8C40C